MAQLLSLQINNSDEIDLVLKRAGWKVIFTHWWSDALHSGVPYKKYARRKDESEEVLIFSKSYSGEYVLQYYAPVEESKSIEEYNGSIIKLCEEMQSADVSAVVVNSLDLNYMNGISIQTHKALYRFIINKAAQEVPSNAFWKELIYSSIHNKETDSVSQQLHAALNERAGWGEDMSQNIVEYYNIAVDAIAFYSLVQNECRKL